MVCASRGLLRSISHVGRRCIAGEVGVAAAGRLVVAEITIPRTVSPVARPLDLDSFLRGLQLCTMRQPLTSCVWLIMRQRAGGRV